MATDRVAAVELLNAELPPPFCRRHRRIAGKRELTIVHIAAHPERFAVKEDFVAATLESAKTETHFMLESGAIAHFEGI